MINTVLNISTAICVLTLDDPQSTTAANQTKATKHTPDHNPNFDPRVIFLQVVMNNQIFLYIPFIRSFGPTQKKQVVKYKCKYTKSGLNMCIVKSVFKCSGRRVVKFMKMTARLSDPRDWHNFVSECIFTLFYYILVVLLAF